MKNVSAYHVRVKADKLAKESLELRTLASELEEYEKLKGIVPLPTYEDKSQMTMEAKKTWPEYVLSRWPTVEEFLAFKEDKGPAYMLSLYRQTIGRKIRGIFELEVETKRIYSEHVQVLTNPHGGGL